MLTIHGAHGSPYTRKVCVFLAEKNLPYHLELTIPWNVSPEYKKISPLGKIPCLKDGDYALPDSSAICIYLEKKYPEPALYPKSPAEFGRALWYEEYADAAIASKVGAKVFFPKVIAPLLFQRPVDEAAVQTAIAEDVPPVFNYLEEEIRGGKSLVGEAFSIADLSITAHLLGFYLAGYRIDEIRWPKLAALVETNLQRPSFKKYFEAEKKTFKVEG